MGGVAQNILLFGFKPFGEYSENPSELVCARLDGRRILESEVSSRVLPVEYGVVERAILEGVEAVHPSIALGLGLAAGRTQICVEKVALNYREVGHADSSGFRPQRDHIDPEGEAAYFSNIPVERVVEALRGAGIPARLSLSAGGYLCNNAMYVICREAHRRGFLGGFIHLPAHEELVAKLGRDMASMSLSTMVKAVELALGVALTQKPDMLRPGEPRPPAQ